VIASSCCQHLKCDHGGYKGYTIDVCRKLKRANTQGDTKGPSNGFSSTHHADFKFDKTKITFSSYSLTTEQYHDLFELIARTKSVNAANQVSTVNNLSSISPNSLTYDKGIRWIFDTGATDHMICSPHFFTTCIPITNRYVHLPNYAFSQVTHIGTIQFSSSLVLYNVLCVLSFKLNLIYVAKLTQTSSCYATFTKNLYFV